MKHILFCCLILALVAGCLGLLLFILLLSSAILPSWNVLLVLALVLAPIIIDVREESEYAADHVPGAVHLSKGVIERDVETQYPDPATELVLYCGGGFRSALAADNLQKMGYTNVISMDGGVRDWRGKGYPMVK